MTPLRAVAALFFLAIAHAAPAALPELRLTSEIVKEGESPAEVRVFVSAPEDQPARFRVSTADGTAIAGEDYVAISNKRVETASGTIIRIIIVDDNRAELEETFYLDVTDVENAVAVTTRVSIKIQDDSVYPEPRLTPAGTQEGDLFERQVEAFVTLPVAFEIPYSVRVFSTPITARPRVDYKPVDETVTFRPGRKSVAIPITIYGDDRHEADETFLLQLDGLSSTAVFTIFDDDEPNSLPGVSIDDVDVIEGTGLPAVARFRVALTEPSLDGVSVFYRTQQRSATEDIDFAGQTGLIRFAPGERVKWIEVEVHADDQAEYFWEFFDVELTKAAGANLEHYLASGRIRDDDTDVRWLKVHDAVAIEGTTAVFRLELSQPSDTPIDVRWVAADALSDAWLPGGRARAGRDFGSKGISTITFQPGEVLKEIRVPIVADSDVEEDEYFGLFVGTTQDIEYDSRPGTGIIIDDDREWEWPQLRVEDAMTVEGDAWTEVRLLLTLSRASDTPSSVIVQTREFPSDDYLEVSETVTFAPGETEKTIAVRIRGDNVAEGLMTFDVDFREPSGLTIVRDSVVITILDDDRPTRSRGVRH